MRKFVPMGSVLVVALLGIVGYWAFSQPRRNVDSVQNMKAGVIKTGAPLSLTAARIRGDCPISLPETATNIQYAVWSLWQASQTFVRFDAPVSDCLEHAMTILRPYAQRPSVSIASTNVIGPLPAPFVVSPTDSTVPWFDLPSFTAGMLFDVGGERAPTVWVDTNRGCFYYAWDE